jgi:chromosome segregation ATPase
MSMRTNRTAALIATTALALSLSAPAATASTHTQPGNTSAQTAQAVDIHTVTAKKAAQKKKSIKKLRRALAKANKAKKAAAKQVTVTTAAVQVAQGRAAGPAQAFAPAEAALTTARDAYAPAKAALDRAQHLVTNEQALYNEIFKKIEAAEAAAKPLRDAYNAANAKVTELRNTENAILASRNTASQNQNNAATAAYNIYLEMTAAQDQYNAALTAEQNAWNLKEAARTDFANRKAQWDDTRKVNGLWQGLRNGTWRFVPGLDDAEALLNQRQAEYNRAKNQRQDIEGYLGSLNQRHAAAQADINYWAAQFAALNDQYNAARANTSAAITAANQARDKWNAYVDANVKPLYTQADNLYKEIEAAKKNLPALVAAEKPLAAAVAQAQAALDAVAPAHQAAQAALAQANTDLAGAQATLVKATKRAKVAKKKLKKALR